MFQIISKLYHFAYLIFIQYHRQCFLRKKSQKPKASNKYIYTKAIEKLHLRSKLIKEKPQTPWEFAAFYFSEST